MGECCSKDDYEYPYHYPEIPQIKNPVPKKEQKKSLKVWVNG